MSNEFEMIPTKEMFDKDAIKKFKNLTEDLLFKKLFYLILDAAFKTNLVALIDEEQKIVAQVIKEMEELHSN